MQKKNIISTALIVASFAGVSVAGTKAVVCVPAMPISAPVASAFSGSAAVGYSSNYDFRGLILRDAHDGGNMTPIRVDTRYALNDKTAITTGAGYKALWNRDDIWGGNFENEFNYNLGLEHKCAPGLTTSVNYNLFHGGIPGFIAKHVNDKSHSITQEFGVGALYDFSEQGAKGLFASVNANYSFAGVTGWWFNATVGYKKDICEKVAAVLSASWNGTSNYYNANAHNWNIGANGTQGMNVRLDLPMTVAKNLTLVPFVGAYWAGCGALKDNRGFDKADKMFRDFTVMSGANLVYTF